MHITTQSICLAVLWQRVVGSCNVPVQKADTSQDDVCSDQRIGLALVEGRKGEQGARGTRYGTLAGRKSAQSTRAQMRDIPPPPLPEQR